jgi:hypothetical protein
VWIAPKDGAVDITSHAAKMNSQGNGVIISITQNDQVIWGPKTIAGDDQTGIDANVANVAVTAGDAIRFVINNNGDWTSDATSWAPDITYQGDPAPNTGPASASYTFSGRQVTYYAKLGPDLGKVQISIDGQPATVVDLYAPDDDNWSVPVYSRTFANAGRHTITITETDQKNSRSGGTGITLDGFAVAVPGASVTAATDKSVSYAGTGWAVASDPSASTGKLMSSGQAGDSVTLTVNGAKRITWVGSTCASCGEADVYVDGKFATRVDTYGFRGPTAGQVALFEQSWAKPGTHTIKIVVTGSKNFESSGTQINVDSFQS